VPKIVGYARYYIEKIRILHVGSFGSWRNFAKEVPPFRLRSLPPRTFGVFLDGMGFLGWIAWTGPDRMDSWTIKG